MRSISNIDGYTNMPKKLLEDLFTKPQKPKTPILIPRPKKSIPFQRPIPSPITTWPIYLTRIENNAIEDSIIKNEAIKDKIVRDIRTFFESKKRKLLQTRKSGNAFSNSYIEYESNCDKIKPYQSENLEKINPFLKDIIKNLKKADTWKIQLTIAINFMSCKDTGGKRVVHSKSDNIEILIGKETDEIIKLFESPLSRYQIGLEESILINIIK